MPLIGGSPWPLWLDAASLAAAAVLVWIVGGRLTRAVDAIADRTRLDAAFAGMLLLGGITSLPEVASVITASSIGAPALGVNNLLGSAAINILMLAIADGIIGREAVTGTVFRPSVMMMGVLCMLVLIVIAGTIAVGDASLGGIGAGGLLICLVSLGSFWVATGYDKRSPWSVAGEEEEKAPDPPPEAHAPLRSLWNRVALYGVLIFLGGSILSATADGIATHTGIGSALVGFALVGIATSMPELSTIVTALRIREPEMAFGQVLGTNFINLSLILLADLVFAGGPVIDELGRFEQVSALLGAMLIGIFMVGLLEHRDRTMLRMGYDSAAAILVFAAGLALLSAIAL